MARRCIHGFGMSCGRPVAAAVIGRAKMRTALDDLARNSDVGQLRVVACGLWPTARIGGNAACLGGVGRVLRRPPIRGPFPRIGELCAVKAAACSELPLRFRRQLLSRPCGVGQRIAEAHVHDRMVVEALDAAAGTVRPPPVRALQQGPPLAPVPEVHAVLDRMARFSEPA